MSEYAFEAQKGMGGNLSSNKKDGSVRWIDGLDYLSCESNEQDTLMDLCKSS